MWWCPGRGIGKITLKENHRRHHYHYRGLLGFFSFLFFSCGYLCRPNLRKKRSSNPWLCVGLAARSWEVEEWGIWRLWSINLSFERHCKLRTVVWCPEWSWKDHTRNTADRHLLGLCYCIFFMYLVISILRRKDHRTHGYVGSAERSSEVEEWGIWRQWSIIFRLSNIVSWG